MKIPWLDSLPPRRRTLLVWGVTLIFCYTIAGFLILPPIVRVVAVKAISRQLDRPVSIEAFRINPYAMSATIRGFLVRDKDGQPLLSWDEVYANFQFWSLLTRTFVFEEIRTTQPYLRVQVNPDASLNFSDLIDKLAREAAAAPKPSKPAKPIALRIRVLRISGARLSATDLTTRPAFTKMVGPLELTLQEFATNPDNRNPYSFHGSTEEGEQFSWSGHFFLDPVRSTGDFTLENLSLARYAPLYRDLVRFEVRDGTVDVRLSYHVEHNDHTNIARLTNTSVTVKSLQLAEAGASGNALEVPQFSLTGLSADAFGRIAEIGSISTRDGRLAVRRNPDASVNLIELAKPSATATNTAGSVQVLLQSLTNVVELLLRSTNHWAGAVRQIQVENYAVRVEDFASARPVRLDLDQIQVDVRNVSNQPGSNLTAAIAMRWNSNGTIRTESSLSLIPLQAEVVLALDRVDLRALDPYLDPFVNLLIKRGEVGLDGRARLRPGAGEGALPDVSFEGGIRVDNFSTMDGVLTEDFVEWKRLNLSGVSARLQPLEVSVKEVALQDARARLVIASAQTNNLFAILRRAGPAPAPAVTATSSNAAPKKSSSRKPHLEIPTNLIASAQAALPKITVGVVSLENVSLDYVDRSLPSAVALAVTEVRGSISGLSSEDLTRADVNITGKVDHTAPMEITGRINPLSRSEFTDLKVAFRGIELIPTSPYSGKFLGYRLNKGKLSLDLRYQLADGRIKGQNLVTLDQLMLGEKVESPEAIKLPIKLGIAILKDRNGRIDLDVPVEGTLGDPEFRLGRVITRALVNVLTKIVTSPFAALGAVFGGKGEEVSFQDFAAGSSELQESGREKLKTVAAGLFERPGLQLEIEGTVDPVADGEALRRLKLRQQFRAKKWAGLRKSERSRLRPEQVELTPPEIDEYLKEAHAAAFSAEAVAARATAGGAPPVIASRPSPAEPSRAGGPKPEEKGAAALMSEKRGHISARLPAADLEGQLLALIQLSESDFAGLAAQRAGRVKEFILQTGKVEPERVFLADKPVAAQTAKASRVYLHLR